MDIFTKYQIHVTATKKGCKPIEVFVDLFTKEAPERVNSIISTLLKKSIKFPFEFEVIQLPQDAILFQACSSVYQVPFSICADLLNIIYYGN